MSREKRSEEIVGCSVLTIWFFLPHLWHSSFHFCQVGRPFSQILIVNSSDYSSVNLLVELVDVVFLFSVALMVWFS